LLNSQQYQKYARGDDRERVTNVRQAAEMLFTPKKQVTDQPVPASGLPSEPSAHKPRFLRALPPASVRREQAEVPTGSQQPMTGEIPSSHFARMRTWVEYGMRTAQAAAVYGVAVGVIERILRQI
jgi:hypothetical protein